MSVRMARCTVKPKGKPVVALHSFYLAHAAWECCQAPGLLRSALRYEYPCTAGVGSGVVTLMQVERGFQAVKQYSFPSPLAGEYLSNAFTSGLISICAGKQMEGLGCTWVVVVLCWSTAMEQACLIVCILTSCSTTMCVCLQFAGGNITN